MIRMLRLGAKVAATTALLVGFALASAQSGATQPTTPPATSASRAPTMAQLQRQALRLTLIARLPEADRAQATRLLDRADALRQRARALRRKELQDYIDALKAGSAPAVARSEAQQKVASERTALAKEASTLRSEVQSFLKKVPQARALLRYFGARERVGMGFGFAPGQRGSYGRANPYGRGVGPGQAGQGWMGPGSNAPGLYGPGRNAPGYGRNAMPFGRMAPGMQQGRFYRGWMDRGWMDRDGMMGPGQDGYMPWEWPGMPQRNGPAPQNGAPQNTTPPSGSGSSGT